MSPVLVKSARTEIRADLVRLVARAAPDAVTRWGVVCELPHCHVRPLEVVASQACSVRR
ncbi:hypothetical protein ROP_pROB01-02700 (plasmid) [Rhodococcus opacus B4]|uniref:Uncharacterized protein n=1 Tax=Rhodococcus opacus (strain B4) TaxID=632772 RepID=C1BD25_RHOOB|nr:hypothetical protein ROP_pROB01-02700 [Rhodococcus opacus B4]